MLWHSHCDSHFGHFNFGHFSFRQPWLFNPTKNSLVTGQLVTKFHKQFIKRIIYHWAVNAQRRPRRFYLSKNQPPTTHSQWETEQQILWRLCQDSTVTVQSLSSHFTFSHFIMWHGHCDSHFGHFNFGHFSFRQPILSKKLTELVIKIVTWLVTK